MRLGNVLALDCTGGRVGALGIYCVRNDAIYVAGTLMCSDKAEMPSKQLRDEAREPQRLTDALHGLSLSTKDSRASKLDELKAAFTGTGIAGVVERLFK
jgi:serine/threonine protein phosphatase 1